ncbi:hypothetical protein MKW92_048784 [Papaver armeniacum]|nr:hypothetical protein MKW92_048784 [Papaver armeniacum]
MSTLNYEWLITWVTPLAETIPLVNVELNDEANNSSNETQLIVEIQVLRSTQYWYYGDKNSNAITHVHQVEEPIILKVFPVNFHDVPSRRDVFRNCDFVPLLSNIYDYIGDMVTVPSNFAPQNFVKDLEEDLAKISNILPKPADTEKRNCFLSVTIPIQVVRIVEVFHAEPEAETGKLEVFRADGEEDKDGDNVSDMEQDCNCLKCLWRRGNFRNQFVREKIDSIPPTSYSSLFDSVNTKVFNGEQKDECSICLKEFENGTGIGELPCSHVFHRRCIINWFAHVTNCPLCRSRVEPLQSETDPVQFILASLPV